MCTCSALTSALLYRHLSNMPDEHVDPWVNKWKLLLLVPLMKFGMGTLSYMISVIFTAWRDLETVELWKYFTLAIGTMSMASVRSGREDTESQSL